MCIVRGTGGVPIPVILVKICSKLDVFRSRTINCPTAERLSFLFSKPKTANNIPCKLESLGYLGHLLDTHLQHSKIRIQHFISGQKVGRAHDTIPKLVLSGREVVVPRTHQSRLLFLDAICPEKQCFGSSSVTRKILFFKSCTSAHENDRDWFGQARIPKSCKSRSYSGDRSVRPPLDIDCEH